MNRLVNETWLFKPSHAFWTSISNFAVHINLAPQCVTFLRVIAKKLEGLQLNSIYDKRVCKVDIDLYWRIFHGKSKMTFTTTQVTFSYLAFALFNFHDKGNKEKSNSQKCHCQQYQHNFSFHMSLCKIKCILHFSKVVLYLYVVMI